MNYIRVLIAINNLSKVELVVDAPFRWLVGYSKLEKEINKHVLLGVQFGQRVQTFSAFRSNFFVNDLVVDNV